ncbi:MAG: hypothetical protein M5U28_43760 [Sandaracinaceae bacterium]|nr:hypothetical protein [Sandaracinaceae bacterium]
MTRTGAALFVLCACGARTAPIVDERADAGVTSCEPSIEVCNGVDDDCDGLADEGLPLTELGDPIVLRSPGETTTGTCRVCDQALRGDVIEIDGGLLALWQMNFTATDPRPNTFARRLDRDGAPLEESRLVTDRYTTLSLEAATLPDGRRVLSFCERVEERSARNDYPSLLLLGAGGRAAGEVVRVSDARCVIGGAAVAVTGARTLLAVRTAPASVELVVVGPDLRAASTTDLGHARMAAIAASGDALVARVTEDSGGGVGWQAHALDPLGAVRATEAFVRSGFVADLALLPRREGWWIATATHESGARLQALTQDGVRVASARPLGTSSLARAVDGVALRDGRSVLIAGFADGGRGDRRELSEMYLVDSEGDIASTWRSGELEEPIWRSPVLRALDDGRVAIVYTTDAPDDEHDEVRLRLLACAP